MKRKLYENLNAENLVVVHHIDMDGYCSGHLVSIRADQNISYIPMNYNYKWDFELFKDNDVFIVDISFNNTTIENLIKICKIAKEVRWVDHHISSKEMIDNPDIKAELDKYKNLRYCVNTNLCATTLMYIINTLEYDLNLVARCNKIDVNLETIYRKGFDIYSGDGKGFYSLSGKFAFIDSWDRFTWKEEGWMEPLYLNSAFYAVNHKLTDISNQTNSFYSMKTDELLNIGKILSDAKEADTKRALYNGYYIDDVCGYHAFVMNTSINPTATLEDRYKDFDCDIFIVWRYSGKTKTYSYSIYSREGINAVEIAQSFEPSGGGHFNAAGFVSDKLLFV